MTANLRRSEWLVEAIPHREAVRLIEAHHYSRSAPNTGQTHGLMRRDQYPLADLYGAALWLPPTPTAARAVAGGVDWRGVLTLSRLVCRPDAPRNAASYLLAASMRLIDRDRWPVLLTYADTRLGHTGAIYRATGWRCEGETPAGDVWIGPAGEQRGRKRGRVNLTAAELRSAGFTPAPAAPKIRFTHRLMAVAS